MKQNIKERIEKIQKGEVPEGYKETKGGIIPEDWNNKKLLQIADYVDYRGKTPQKTNNGVFLVTAKNIKKGFIDYKISKEFVSENKYMDIMRRGLPKLGDVLITTEAPVGNVAQIDKENIALAQRVIKYRGKEDEIDNTYMKFYFLGFKFQKEILIESTGGTVQGIKGSRLHKLKISFPKIKEQQKIAEILSTWDNAIELKEKLIEEKKEFKRGLMQNLLTGEIRFPEFTGDWEEKKLGDIFSERKEINQNGSELLSITSSRGVIKRSEIEGKDNSSKDKSKYKKICRGDIGYNTMRMWQGVSAVSEYEGIVSPAYTIAKLKEDGDIYYFGYLFKLRKIIDLFWRYSQGLVNDTLNLKYENFKIIKITVPTSKVEQEKISATLKSIDTEISSIKAEKELLEKQKRGLMQLLLAGIVRVNT